MTNTTKSCMLSNENLRKALHLPSLISLLPVHRYGVDIFSHSGLSGILGSGGKQNTPLASARGCENSCTFY